MISFAASRTSRLIGLVLLAAPGAALAQSAAPVWSLKIWPGQAMMLETRKVDDRVEVLRTIECENGQPLVASRRFRVGGEGRMAGEKSCGAFCRMRLSQVQVNGLTIPRSFVETRAPIRTVRRTIDAEIQAEVAADPWRDANKASLRMISQVADACRLPLPTSIAQGAWSPINKAAIVGLAPGQAGLPQAYKLQAKSRAYTPITKPTSADAIIEPLIMRATVLATVGQAALALVGADGQPLSPETALTPKDGQVAVFFALSPGTTAFLAARNNAPDAAVGALVVTKVEFALKSRFDKDDLIDLEAAIEGQAKGRLNIAITALSQTSRDGPCTSADACDQRAPSTAATPENPPPSPR
jgi:hypothetical protein